MKRVILILAVVLLLCGCADKGDAAVKVTTDSDPIEITNEATVEPEPTPVPLKVRVPLPTDVSDNEKFLKSINLNVDSDFQTEMETPISELVSSEDEAYYVEFNQNRMNGLQLDRPDMPMFRWYINGSHADKIAQVMIEFDLLETIHPLHPGFFDYDRGYFVTLHYDQAIKNETIYYEVRELGVYVNTITRPELGEDMSKYAEQNGTHVTITIPYAEFQSAAKDLSLRFLPGTTFANLDVYLLGANELDPTIISEVEQKIDRPEHNLLDEVLSLMSESQEADNISKDMLFNIGDVGGQIWGYDGNGFKINSDGIINMPVSFYDLGEYEDEIEGKYAVIPEGLIPAFATLSSCSYLGDVHENLDFMTQQKRKLVDFAFENLMDETGQFHGIYDIAQGKVVATERKSSALPILSSMCGSICGLPDTSVLTNKEIKFLLNSIIANDIIRVGDKLYYAPHGISVDGVMDIKLSDLYISHSLLGILIDYAVDEDSLDEKYGVAMLLEGYVNSLKLVVEGQEQNETRLPSSDLVVVFKEDGNAYDLYPSDTFDINDAFFANLNLIGSMMDVFPGEGAPFSRLELERTKQSIANRMSSAKNGVFDDYQKLYIRECERQYAEIYNMYELQTTLYECFLHIYSFLQMQPTETAYAPKYNVHTGEMIEASTDTMYPQYRELLAPMVSRIGTPATLMNYNLLMGVFNDEAGLADTAIVIPFMYKRWMGSDVFTAPVIDLSDPDLYADNGFEIWGYDSLYPMGGCYTVDTSSMPFYDRLGMSFSREDWKAYTMRNVNAKTRKEENLVSPDDEFPLFYDHLQRFEITE